MQFTYVSLGTVMSVCFRRIEIQTGLEEGVVHEEGFWRIKRNTGSQSQLFRL